MTRRPIHPDDLLKIRNLIGAALSPDGTRVVYAATRIDAEAATEHSDLFLVDVATGGTRRLTHIDALHTAPAFSPDGETLAFLSTRNNVPQLWLLPLAGGEARQLTSLAQGVGSGPVWSPDGSRVAFTAGAPGPRRDPAAPYRVTRSVWRADGVGLIDDALQDVYVVDVDGGGEPRRLTDDALLNTNPSWTPDGQALVYAAAYDPESFAMASRVCQVTLDGTVTELSGLDGLVHGPDVAADGRIAYLLVFENGTKPGTRWPLCVIDPATGERTRRGTTVEGHFGGLILSDIPALALGAKGLVADDDLFVSVQRGGAVNISRIPLSGEDREEVLVSGDRAAGPVAVAAGKLLFVGFTMTEPGDLYLLDLATGEEKRLTSVNEEILSELAFPTAERLSFTGSDGAEVEGWYLKPPEATGPYPTVLAIHGGPHAAFGYHFHFDALMLTGAGFGVLQVNHRASTGYGDEFATAIFGDWGNLDYNDLMAGVDHAISLGLADADRLGVFGISGGGNLTGWIIGHTDRFKAAAPHNPVFNFTSLYGVSDVGVWMGENELGGAPHEIPEIYQRCSPITYAHKVTTPTLFMQDENDYRCPAEQTEQFYTVLRVKGVRTEMLRFPGTGHGGTVIGPVGHRRVQNDALLDWMNQYVLGKAEKSS